jgi:hypothetical protein
MTQKTLNYTLTKLKPPKPSPKGDDKSVTSNLNILINNHLK